MAIANLTYATINAIISVLRDTLLKDARFKNDSTGASRSGESLVAEAWGENLRDFPTVVILDCSGANRRTDLRDSVRSFFGVKLLEADGSGASAIFREFFIPDTIPVGTNVRVEFKGPPATSPSVFLVPAEDKVFGPDTKRIVRIEGTVGPEATYPLSKFEASSDISTGQIFGTWYDMNLQILVVARSTQERALLTDTVWDALWFSKKKELRKRGIVILDVRLGGFSQEPYGQDLYYASRLSVACATEAEAVALYQDTVEEVTLEVTAEAQP
jgi:hypothetical protein